MAKSTRVAFGEGDADNRYRDEVIFKELIDVVGEDPLDSDANDIEPIEREEVVRDLLNEKADGLEELDDDVERVVRRKGIRWVLPNCKKTDKAATR